MSYFEQIARVPQLVLAISMSFLFLTFHLSSSANTVRTKRSLECSKKIHGTSTRSCKLTPTSLLLCLSLLLSSVTAEIIAPSCSKNICTLPSYECVETCPKNQRGAYFRFGLRSNQKCVAPTTPGRSLHNDTSTRLALIRSTELGEASLNQTKELRERQTLWPEFGPPSCYYDTCQFVGPPCILFCTEDKVYYGTSDLCKDGSGTQASTGLTAVRPLSLMPLIVLVVVLMGVTGFSQDVSRLVPVMVAEKLAKY